MGNGLFTNCVTTGYRLPSSMGGVLIVIDEILLKPESLWPIASSFPIDLLLLPSPTPQENLQVRVPLLSPSFVVRM